MHPDLIDGRDTEAVTQQFLTFVVDGEEYGVDILRVQEIKGWSPETPLPNAPDFVRGVINLRGTIVPVIDLRRRFGLPEASFESTAVTIVLKVRSDEGRERTVGIAVDAVEDVRNLSTSSIQEAPDFGHRVRSDFLQGLAARGSELLILLDVDRILDPTEMAAMNRAAEVDAEIEQEVLS